MLAGLGVSSAAAAAAVPAVGSALSRVTMDQCRRAAAGALEADDPQAARTAARAALSGVRAPAG